MVPSPFSTPDDSARAIFLAWERLRVVFNVALALVVLALDCASLGDRSFWKYLARGAVAANVCFCAGPVAEGYLALLGLDRRVARWAIFVPGLLLGCLLAFAAVFAWHMRGFGD